MTAAAEIPEDIRKTANALVGDYLDLSDSRNAQLAKLVANAILAERQRDQWQPIETAPKNGVILAYFPLKDLGADWCRVMPVYYSETMHPRPWIFAGRAASSYGEGPSHWMPLPAAPKGGA